jgi:hypothetical protein
MEAAPSEARSADGRSGVLVADASALTSWLATALDEAGIPRGPVLLALPREALVVRRLELPSAEPHELPEMARLAMRRDLPLDGGEAAIDFFEIKSSATGVPSEVGLRHELGAEGKASTQSGRGRTTVMAVAVLRRTLDDTCAALAAAGRPVVAATARMLGSTALVRAGAPELLSDAAALNRSLSKTTASEASAAGIGALVIDVARDGVEFLILERGGEIGFSRGALWREASERAEDVNSPAATDAPAAHLPEPRRAGLAGGAPLERAIVEAAVAEVRRSWMAYRMTLPPGGDSAQPLGPTLLHLFADSTLRPALLPALAAATGLEAAPERPLRELLHGVDPAGCAPLAGLHLPGCPRIDLLHPRKSPDQAARRRQTLIAAAGVLILSGLFGYTLGRREADAVAARRDDIAEKARGALAEGWRLRRDEDKLRHVAQWSRPAENWLEDFMSIKQLLPAPGEVVLDKVDATQEFSGVKWERPRPSRSSGAQAPSAGAESAAPRWQSAAEVRIVLEGEARTRAIADALREKFIADSRFSTTTSGSDARGGERLPYPFGFLLRAQRSDVTDPAPSP